MATPTDQLSGWSTFFSSLSTLLREVERMESPVGESKVNTYLSELEYRLSGLIDIFVFLSSQQGSHNCDQQLTDSVEYLILSIFFTLLPNLKDKLQSSSQHCVSDLAFGEEQLRHLRSIGFTWVAIAQIFGVSRMTLYRRRIQLGIIGEDKFSDVSDFDLMNMISSIKARLPDCGERMIIGFLRSQGVFVQRCRIRSVIHAIDPIGTSLRWHPRLLRRPYSVPGPMSLWHIGKQKY